MYVPGRMALVLTMLIAGPLCADLQWQPDRTVRSLARPCQVALGDLNHDGQADLAVSCAGTTNSDGRDDPAVGSVVIFFQQKGRFAAQPDREVKVARPWGVLIADFDADGKADLAVKDSGKKLHLFLGGEDLAVDHAAPNINDCERLVSAGRLSPGGLMDFLAGPVWRKWRGGDQFQSGYCYGPKVNDNRLSVMADLDQDGNNDVLFSAGSEIRLYYGPLTNMIVRAEELGQFVTIHSPCPIQSLAVADLNGDARPDILAGLYDSAARQRSVAVWRQRAPIGFGAEASPDVLLAGLGGGLDTADLNRDGLTDLVVSDGSARRIFVFLQRPGQSLSGKAEQADQVLQAANQDVVLGDVDGDGLVDMAVSDGRSAVTFFMNDGQGAAPPVANSHGPAQPVPSKPTVSAPSKKKAVAAPKITVTAPGVPAPSLHLPPPQPGPDYEDPLRMPFYTGTILPVPQDVTYHDEFFPLDQTGIVLGPGIEFEGPLVAELRQRIERYGGRLAHVDSAAAPASTLILLGDVPAAEAYLQGDRPPEREQGYLVRCQSQGDRKVVVLQGRDRLGLLWAIASFNQLVHQRAGHTVVRAADVRDYPEMPNRGFIAGNWVDGVGYCLAFKLNKPVFQSALADRSQPDRRKSAGAWRNPLPEQVRRDLAAYGQRLSPLGITWYAGINPIVGPEKIRSGNEQDFQAILEKARAVAEVGGHLCLKYDDHRFPISPDDLQQFGSAREADVHFLNRLYGELQQRHPHARILFCPPFYWGPDSPAIYPEPRDDYLYALGKRLPPGIEIFWTGPRVKSGRVTPEMVQWITDRIGRKPVYWQNGFGAPHMFLYHYATDPVRVYQEWFYPEFWGQADCYMLNCSMPAYAAAVATCSDFGWNPKTYDAERSVREAASKLVGPDTYPALVALNQALSWFDPFGLRRTPAAAQQLPEMERRLAAVNAAWSELQRRNFRAVQTWTGMQRHVEQVARFYQQLRSSPNLAAYRDEAAESQHQAARETGFSEDRDQLLSAYDFAGGAGSKPYAVKCEKRLATWIYGAQSPNPSMEASFTVEPFPPSGDYELIISAQDDDAEAACRIRIVVNEAQIFAGPNPFPTHGWARQTFRIPGACLQRQNRLRIENAEPTGHGGGAPFFMLNYAVIRRGEG